MKLKSIVLFVLSFSIVATFITCKKDSHSDSKGSLKVIVRNKAGHFLNGVDLSLSHKNGILKNKTGPNGIAIFEFVPIGENSLTISFDTYLTETTAINIKENTETVAEIELIDEKAKIPIELIDYTNGYTPLQDSIYLHFNKKVKVNSITSSYIYCVSDLPFTYTYMNDSSLIKFNYTCAELGKTYPFNFSVSDEYGNTLTQDIDISFYTKKISFPDYSIYNLIISDDNQFAWCTAVGDFSNDFRLIKVSLKSFEVIQNTSIPEAPTFMTINPHNGLIYISSFDASVILVIDPKDGKILKRIIPPKLPENPFGSDLQPTRITFTESGFGIYNAGFSWRVIDSSKGDSIYYHNYIKSATDYSYMFNHQLMSNGRDIIGFSQQSYKIEIINGDTKEIGPSYDSPVQPSNSGNFFFPNKKNNTVLVYSGVGVLMDIPSGKLSKVGYTNHLPWNFSYRENEENHVFLIGKKDVMLFDYGKAETVFQFPFSLEIAGQAGTSDGKYLVINTPYDLLFFDEKMFPGRNHK
jgi:hypothetical protein